jgi:DeoR/GlpR family transcriptional regulator of sugar metabolism
MTIRRDMQRLERDGFLRPTDGGATVHQKLAAAATMRRDDLMIVTPSLTIPSLLGTRKVKTIVVGGLVRRDELNCVGRLAVNGARRYKTELAVIGAGVISVRRGIAELDGSEAEVITSALEHTDTVMVIADSSKFGAVTLSTVAPIARIGIIVTDAAAPLDEVRAIEALGTKGVPVDVTAASHEPIERAG